MGCGNFELVRHDVTSPYYAEVDQIYNLACPASPIHYQYNRSRPPRPRSWGRSTCWGLPNGSGPAFCRPPRRRCTAIPTSTPRRKPIGDTSIRSACAPAMTREAVCRVALHGLPPSERRGYPHRPYFQYLRAEHEYRRRPRHLEFHRAGAAGRGADHLRRRFADAAVSSMSPIWSKE